MIFDIFRNFRYEGHPSLWYLIIWPFTRFTSNPATIQVLNLLIAAVAVFLIAKTAPAPQWLRAIVVFGYFPVYEYGTIARNYALSLLLVIAFCVLFEHRRKRPILLGLLLFFASNTSLPACVLSLAAVLALAAEAIISPPDNSRRFAIWAGLVIATGGIVLSVLQIRPPPDGAYPEWFFQFDPKHIKNVLFAVSRSYIPMPKPGMGFWQSSIFDFLPKNVGWVWITISAMVLLILTSLALVRRPFALAYYLFGTLGLLAFFYMKAPGYLRHHGFLFVCFGTALWLARTIQPIMLPRSIDLVSRRAERVIVVVFPLLLVFHLVAAGIASSGEYSQVFSAAKDTAALMREKGLEHYVLVGAHENRTAPVVGYLDKDRAYYSNDGRFGSYIVWKKNSKNDWNLWDDAHRFAERQKTPVVVLVDNNVLRKSPPPSELLTELSLVGCRGSDVVTEESYCVYLLGEGWHDVRTPIEEKVNSP